MREEPGHSTVLRRRGRGDGHVELATIQLLHHKQKGIGGLPQQGGI